MSGVRCQVSGVTCHMSHVRCEVSGVTCQVSHVTFFIYFLLDKVVELVGGGSVINGAYLVYFIEDHISVQGALNLSFCLI